MITDVDVINDLTAAAERCGGVAAEALFLATWDRDLPSHLSEAAWDACLDHMKEAVASLLREVDPAGYVASFFTDIANEAMIRRFDELNASLATGGAA